MFGFEGWAADAVVLAILAAMTAIGLALILWVPYKKG